MEIQKNAGRALPILALLVASGGALAGATWSETSAGLPTAVPGVIALTVDPKTPSTIYARSTEGSVFKTIDGAQSWRFLGGVVGVASLVVDPKTPSSIYAIASRGIVLKSTDGGENWTGASSGMTAPFGTLAIDPVTPSTLYAASYLNGVFKSTDAGRSWRAVNGAPRNTFEIVIDPVTPSTIYAPGDIGIFKSTDGGENWSALSGLPANAPVTAVAIVPTDSSTIYLGYLDRAARSTAVIKTTDAGKSWSALDTGLDPRAAIRSIRVDPNSPSTLYITFQINTRVGFIRSRDGGQSWKAIDEGLPAGTTLIRSLAIDPADSSTIYAAYYDVRTIGGGVLKSTSGGAAWERADAGLTDIDIRTLAIDPRNAATVYAGGRDGLFRSLDGGTSWTNLISFQLPAPNWPPPLSQPPPFGAGPAHTRSLLIDFANPNVLYARTLRYNACAFSDKLVFKSVDGGVSWSDGASPPTSGCLLSDLMVMDPTDPNTIYMAEAEDGSWLLKSTDGGAHWTTIWDWTRGMESAVNALTVDPTNSATLYAGIGDVAQITPGSTVSGLMKSTDGGTSWANIGLRGSAVTVLAINPADPGILYAATEGFTTEPRGFRGLFKSTDSGASWVAVNKGLERLIDTRSRISALVIHRDNPDVLYAGTSGAGVFRSTDGGANWISLNQGLANRDIRVLVMAPGDPVTLYAGTSSGVFKIVDVAAVAGNVAFRGR